MERLIGIWISKAPSKIWEILPASSMKVMFVEMDLSRNRLDISETGLKCLKARKIDIFYQVAAFSDFRHAPEIVSKLEAININGMKSVLDLLKQLKV